MRGGEGRGGRDGRVNDMVTCEGRVGGRWGHMHVMMF